MNKEISFMYEAFIHSENQGKPPKKDKLKIDPKPSMGYLGKIDDYRKIFEKLYKT